MDADDPKGWSDKILTFFLEMSNAALNQGEANNVEKVMNFFTIKALQAKLSNMDVAKFLDLSGQSGYTNHIAINPAMLTFINSYLDEEHLDLLKQYAVFTLLDEFAPYLNSEIANEYAYFNQIENNLAWEAVKKLAEMEVGELFAKQYFPAESKKVIENMTRDILNAHRDNLENQDWLSGESKAEAIKKIDSMVVKIGYPENYPYFAKGTVISSDDGGSLIDNEVAIYKAKAFAELGRVTGTVDRTEWHMSPHTINALYDPSLNDITFPAAILQAPFFCQDASYAKNLGGIGAVIAHEITPLMMLDHFTIIKVFIAIGGQPKIAWHLKKELRHLLITLVALKFCQVISWMVNSRLAKTSLIVLASRLSLIF